MDGDQFDERVRRLGIAIPRRGLLAQVGAFAGLGLSAFAALDALADKQKKRKKRRRRRKKQSRDTRDLQPLCDPTANKKVAMCHVPPGNPANAHVTCIAPSGCNGHANDSGDCVCGAVPDGCLKNGQPFPQCEAGRCRPNGACAPSGQTCADACNLADFPCAQPPVGAVPNCRCQLNGLEGTCVDCPPARVCGLACCPAGQICCNGECIDTSSLCGGICGNVCADEETCCGSDCVPTADLCPDCGTICTGTVCCGNTCVAGQECCENDQCDQVCQTGVCDGGTCSSTPTPPNEPGPFCNRPGEVCCEEAGTPVCCQSGEVCIESGCCTPRTCADFSAGTCGPQNDGCEGQTADCPCPEGQQCGTDGVCFFPQCVPDPIDVACAGLQCGPASDGCGADYNCGDCGSRRRCVTGVCKAVKKKRCLGSGLAGQPCGGKCKCKNGRRCHNGRCCEPVGDGSVHCTANSDCCPGLMCARRRPGQHKVCMRRNAKIEDSSSVTTPPAGT